MGTFVTSCQINEPEKAISQCHHVKLSQGEATTTLTVDYDLTLSDMILRGSYDLFNDDITPKRFPLEGKGMVEFEIKLFHFDRSVSSEDAACLITNWDKQNPLVPGEIEHLLAFGARYPNEQRKYPVVALGGLRATGFRYATSLGKVGTERRLFLDLWGDQWIEDCRFLAVRRAL